MKGIFEVVSTVILSVGGAGAIIFALSNWLGKVWANRILENEKAEHNKEIEDYKSRLELELQKYNYLNDKATHISKKQYEKEFEFYMEIWESLTQLTQKTFNLFRFFERVPKDEEKNKEFKLEKYEEYRISYNNFVNLYKKYLPFYDKNISEKFIEFRDLCIEQGATYGTYISEPLVDNNEDWTFDMSKEERKKARQEIPKKIQDLEDGIAVVIREYLMSLQELSD